MKLVNQCMIRKGKQGFKVVLSNALKIKGDFVLVFTKYLKVGCVQKRKWFDIMKWNDDSALEKDIQTSSLSTAEEKEEKKFSSVTDF